MLKKISLLTMLLIALSLLQANASTWKLHDCYVAANMQNVCDVGNYVYYVNCNQLFRFDKTTTETASLSVQNVMSDKYISQIYYDYKTGLLFVAYSNSNIDVIDKQGNVTNISGIADVTFGISTVAFSSGDVSSFSGKEINDITFTDGKAYVATGFGYVIIDESTLTISKCVNLEYNVRSVAMMGPRLVLMTSDKCFYGDPDNTTSPFTDYTSTTGLLGDKTRTYPIDENKLIVLGSALRLYNFSNDTLIVTNLVLKQATSVQKSPTGYIANFQGLSFYYTINEEGTTATQASSIISFASSDPNGDGTVWIADANGLHTSGSTTYYKPNAISTNEPYWLAYNGYLGKLYVGVSGPNAKSTDTYQKANVINTYDGSTWRDATAYNAVGAGYEFVFDPTDLSTYYRSTWSNQGIKKVTNDKLVMTYTTSNSPITKYKPNIAMDNYGNLWVVSSYNLPASPVVVLPKDKAALTSVSTSDWFQPSGMLTLNTGTMKRARFLVSKKTNIKIFNDGDYNSTDAMGSFYCWDNGSSDPTIDNYQFISYDSFTDQLGLTVSWTYTNCIEEDKDGLIWVGHNNGIYYFDPSNIFQKNMIVTRPYVSSSDEGQGYLCQGLGVYDIAIDRDNTKWLATNTNGVYHVSADGTQLLEHFTTDNSDLPSNAIFSLECDTINGRVFIYSQAGFAEYIPDGDAATLDFSNVYAYPNPVEPDFTGLIKIKGLMENSYLTITNREGTVVAQLGPANGAQLWDGCDDNGERLPTGIYQIYAAQGTQPELTTPVAKIMIIK